MNKEGYMKNYSRILSKWSLENIDKWKFASEATKKILEKNAFLTTKYEQYSELRTFALSKSGGRTSGLVPPHFWKWGKARDPPTLSYASE